MIQLFDTSAFLYGLGDPSSNPVAVNSRWLIMKMKTYFCLKREMKNEKSSGPQILRKIKPFCNVPPLLNQ